MQSPYEFLKEFGLVITQENESDDCDQSWSMMGDFMILFAQRYAAPIMEENTTLKAELKKLRKLLPNNQI